MEYLDFDITLERRETGYRAKVLNSPAGQAEHLFHLPFSDLEIENYLLKFGRSQRGQRGLAAFTVHPAETFGTKLFEAVFAGEVRDALYRSLDEAERMERGLRLRLRLSHAPDLCDLPWEYLRNPPQSLFFGLSERTPLVRFLDLPEPVRAHAVTPPVSILVVIASPTGYPELQVEEEWFRLQETLRALERQKRLRLTRLKAATLPVLQAQLGAEEYHILHFIGHGGFDQQAQETGLVLENEFRQAHLLGGQRLGVLFRDARKLKLVVLNACEGARGARRDLFAGPAQSLVRCGIPAVIAMQFAILDDVAITFAQEFYGALAQGAALDTALTKTRKAIFSQGHAFEWAAPVLYLRAPDGKIFDLAAPARSAATPEAWSAKPQLVDRLYLSFVRLSILSYLNALAPDSPHVNITAVCRALGVKKRRFAVLALKRLSAEGLLEKITIDKKVSWLISEKGREALHTLAGWIDTKIHVPAGGD